MRSGGPGVFAVLHYFQHQGSEVLCTIGVAIGFFFFLVGLRDLKSGTHAYTAANPLSADPFPQLEVQLKIEKW